MTNNAGVMATDNIIIWRHFPC